MSDSESDQFLSDEDNETRINSAINNCLSLKPTYVKANKSKAKNMNNLRSQLQKCTTTTTKQRSSARIDDKKKLEEYFREMSTDFSNLGKKFDTIISCLTGVFDKIDEIESRMNDLESRATIQQGSLYADIAAAPPRPPDDARLDKIEYITSEEERKRRSLEVSLTHPDIDHSTEDLNNHLRVFLSGHMKMENRSIDANMRVRKSSRDHSVLITLSDIRYKRFLFAASKQLRLHHPQLYQNFYLNENLTSYNFELLRTLKTEKKRRNELNLPCYDTVYSFDGRIFIKKTRTTDRTSAICINTRRSLQNLMNEYGSTTLAPNNPSC